MPILVPTAGEFVATARDEEELDVSESEISGYSNTATRRVMLMTVTTTVTRPWRTQMPMRMTTTVDV